MLLLVLYHEREILGRPAGTGARRPVKESRSVMEPPSTGRAMAGPQSPLYVREGSGVAR